MTYKEAVEYLMGQLPFYQRIGPAAYKANLDNSLALSKYFNRPEQHIRHIHIAGTNGKGSVAHMIASILQEQGYRTGLATSPHLKDFRERIKINGKPISKTYVRGFVKDHKAFFESLKPSFFEMGIALTFKYFFDKRVDIAVVETGLGGRLDSTNIIRPLLSVITNIGLDHTNLLGDTLEKIAFEKAGIIKDAVPVLIGKHQAGIHHVFEHMAEIKQARIYVAEKMYHLVKEKLPEMGDNLCREMIVASSVGDTKTIRCDLMGNYQVENAITALSAIDIVNSKGLLPIGEDAVLKGLASVVSNTGLAGRWHELGGKPRVICDTGHNAEGLIHVVEQIRQQRYDDLHMVIGVVSDKDPGRLLSLLPKEARYYFCAPDVPRAMPANQLKAHGHAKGLNGDSYSSVKVALDAARKKSGTHDLVFVGGSTFVVAEVL